MTKQLKDRNKIFNTIKFNFCSKLTMRKITRKINSSLSIILVKKRDKTNEPKISMNKLS